MILPLDQLNERAISEVTSTIQLCLDVAKSEQDFRQLIDRAGLDGDKAIVLWDNPDKKPTATVYGPFGVEIHISR